MIILPNNVAVIEGDTHHASWCREQGLVHDLFTANILRDVIRQYGVNTVVDAGANIGTLTRVFLDAGCKVHAFEPNPKAVECLRYNCPEATVYECGLSDRSRKMGFVDCDNAGASFLTEKCEEFLTVQTQPLDLFAISPKLIKLDVEGFEYSAIMGARNIIERNRPVIVSEVNESALLRAGASKAALGAILSDLGYSWTIMQPDCQWGGPQFDILAIPG